MSAEPRIVVLGAGSIGCFIGGAWQAAGLRVTFIGRGKLSHDLQQHGLTLSDYDGREARFQPDEIDYRCGPEGLRDADVILLCVKSGATATGAQEIAEHGREGSTVISFQNGISNIEVLGRRLGGRFDVVRGMVPFNVAYLGEGRFHKGVAGDLFTERRSVTQTLVEQIGSRLAALKLSDNMLELAWGKLLINLNNAVNALSGRTLVDELRQRDYRRVFAASMQEGLTLLRHANIRPATVGPISPHLLPSVINSPDWLFNNLFLKRWKIDSKARSSMADDLAAGRKTEVDLINGELVALADRLHEQTPFNRKIAELVHQAESGAPPWAPDELRREVLSR